MAKVKITVVKKINNKDLFGEHPPTAMREGCEIECNVFELGQEFLVNGNEFPVGFCPWAFADIQRDLTLLRLGGDYPWMRERGVILSCCTDGNKPVIFRLERIED